MRILVTNENATIRGGVETYLAAVLPALVARGHGLAFLHGTDPLPGEPTVTGGMPDVERIPSRSGDALARAIAFRPDVVWSHGIADVDLDAALVARWPTAFQAHAYGGACVSGTKRFAFPAIEPCTRALGPACLALYHVRRCGGLNPITLLADYRLESKRRALLDRCAAVLVLSPHMKRELERQGLAPERISVLPFPVGGAVDPVPAPRPATNRVLLVSRLTALKGGTTLVEAVALAASALGRKLALVVAGEGPEGPRIEALARRLAVPLELAGWVDGATRDALMRGADVLAVPSLWPEPLGLVGLEAAVVGLPSVAFAVGGIKDWCRTGVSGELAPGDRPTAAGLADALVRALRDPEHLQRLRIGARESALGHSLEAHVAALEPLLSRTASAPR